MEVLNLVKLLVPHSIMLYKSELTVEDIGKRDSEQVFEED